MSREDEFDVVEALNLSPRDMEEFPLPVPLEKRDAFGDFLPEVSARIQRHLKLWNDAGLETQHAFQRHCREKFFASVKHGPDHVEPTSDEAREFAKQRNEHLDTLLDEMIRSVEGSDDTQQETDEEFDARVINTLKEAA